MPPAPLRETDLYPPVKRFLETQGYSVKGEVLDCDVVAVRDGDDPVIVELKTAFTLPLLFQALNRRSVTDTVYVAVAETVGGNGVKANGGLWQRHYRDIVKLCRMLGLGLISVAFRGRGQPVVAVHLDPAPYRPRQSKARRGRLLSEFQRRVGDPTPGGGNKRPIVTAYRQDALRCAAHLGRHGPTKVAAIRQETGVGRAAGILQNDVYGWFERVERGVYRLTPKGEKGLATYADVVAMLEAA
jgi:hypothetical protein